MSFSPRTKFWDTVGTYLAVGITFSLYHTIAAFRLNEESSKVDVIGCERTTHWVTQQCVGNVIERTAMGSVSNFGQRETKVKLVCHAFGCKDPVFIRPELSLEQRARDYLALGPPQQLAERDGFKRQSIDCKGVGLCVACYVGASVSGTRALGQLWARCDKASCAMVTTAEEHARYGADLGACEKLLAEQNDGK